MRLSQSETKYLGVLTLQSLTSPQRSRKSETYEPGPRLTYNPFKEEKEISYEAVICNLEKERKEPGHWGPISFPLLLKPRMVLTLFKQ